MISTDSFVDNLDRQIRVLSEAESPSAPDTGSGRLIVWNHRWEHDKGPDELGAIVGELIDRGVGQLFDPATGIGTSDITV